MSKLPSKVTTMHIALLWLRYITRLAAQYLHTSRQSAAKSFEAAWESLLTRMCRHHDHKPRRQHAKRNCLAINRCRPLSYALSSVDHIVQPCKTLKCVASLSPDLLLFSLFRARGLHFSRLLLINLLYLSKKECVGCVVQR